ncbi:MAG: hypothetical protein O6837_07085 [Deltaproteobacteria bacterium]|nr:hypothetical protein [Deltaproteobacteria bacterium]
MAHHQNRLLLRPADGRRKRRVRTGFNHELDPRAWHAQAMVPATAKGMEEADRESVRTSPPGCRAARLEQVRARARSTATYDVGDDGLEPPTSLLVSAFRAAFVTLAETWSSTVDPRFAGCNRSHLVSRRRTPKRTVAEESRMIRPNH